MLLISQSGESHIKGFVVVLPESPATKLQGSRPRRCCGEPDNEDISNSTKMKHVERV